MNGPGRDEAELARRLRVALAQSEPAAAPAFERLWRNAQAQRLTPRPARRIRWQPVALALSVLAAAWWLHGTFSSPSDQQLRHLSAATERQVWSDPFGGISASMPKPVDGAHLQLPDVKYPLVPEQRYL